MKKYLILFLMMFSFVSTYAQTQWYNTTAFAQAQVYDGRYYWGEWERSNMLISIDITNDIIKVFSPVTQIYRVYGTANNGNVYYDKDGGQNVKFYVIDQDYDKGEIRLRVERNGNSQIYIDFADIAWVYNVRRRE